MPSITTPNAVKSAQKTVQKRPKPKPMRKIKKKEKFLPGIIFQNCDKQEVVDLMAFAMANDYTVAKMETICGPYFLGYDLLLVHKSLLAESETRSGLFQEDAFSRYGLYATPKKKKTAGNQTNISHNGSGLGLGLFQKSNAKIIKSGVTTLQIH